MWRRLLTDAGTWAAAVAAGVLLALVAFVVIDSSVRAHNATDAAREIARASAAGEEATQRQIRRLEDRIAELSDQLAGSQAEVSALRTQIEALRTQIEDLGGEPVVGRDQPSSRPPRSPPDDDPSPSPEPSPEPEPSPSPEDPPEEDPTCVGPICIGDLLL